MSGNSGRVPFIHARKGLTDAGVGRPFGLGRFSRKPSEGLYQFDHLSVHAMAVQKNDTHVTRVPWETFAVVGALMLMLPIVVLFSLLSALFRPLLFFDHPNAVRRAVDAARGRGGSPKTRSGLSGETTHSFDTFDTFDGIFGLIVICCNAVESGEG